MKFLERTRESHRDPGPLLAPPADERSPRRATCTARSAGLVGGLFVGAATFWAWTAGRTPGHALQLAQPQPLPQPLPARPPAPMLMPTPTPTPIPIPSSVCSNASQWSNTDRAFEDRVLVLVNQARNAGTHCGSEGQYAPTAALGQSELLRDLSRRHSCDMAVRNYFSHIGLEGQTPWERFIAAGIDCNYLAENIAGGPSTPESVVQTWLSSARHCSSIMDPKLTQLGTGLYRTDKGYRFYWTQGIIGV